MDKDLLAETVLGSAIFRFRMYKTLGDGALEQLSEIEDFLWTPDAESNSIGIILKHLHGNMLSRWTDFLTTDGEKETRARDAEFELGEGKNRQTFVDEWEAGWACLFNALESLDGADLMREVRIRDQGLTVIDAILRQLGHVSYHVGQIVWIAKSWLGSNWKTLSIPRGESKNFDMIRKIGPDYEGRGSAPA